MAGFHRRFGIGALGSSGRFFGPGELRLALLALVMEQPSHGYELMARLERRFAGAYRASAGAVYPTLQQLEDEALVRVETVDGRKIHHATEQGTAEVAAHQGEIEAIWARATSRGQWAVFRDPDAAEVVRPTLRLVKAAVKTIVHAHGDPTVVEQVLGIIHQAREQIERLEPRRRRK
jgi:DNA-binding PadR family transcriptional regulator